MSKHTTRFLAALLAAAVVMPVLACGGGGGGKEGTRKDEDLAVVAFDLQGRTDVYRNQPLRIQFTAPVKPSSLSSRTVRVLGGPDLETPVQGAVYIDPESKGNVVIFDPTRSQAQVERLGPDAPADLAFGFEALANHRLYIPAPPVGVTLTNKAGHPIVSEFVANFNTAEGYIPELEPPRFVGIDGSGELGFLPPRNEDGKVPYNAEALIQFSEPIDPATMSPGVTVVVKNLDVLDFQGNPIDIPGTLRASRDGKTYAFSPSFHYGTGPYHISLMLDREIRDLAGNPLSNPKTIVFETEQNLDVDTISTITETFSNNTYEDRLNTDAAWNTTVSGQLQGGAITTTEVTVAKKGDGVQSRNLLVDFPLIAQTSKAACPAGWPDGARVQNSYLPDKVQSEGKTIPGDLNNVTGSITQVAWGPDSNALFAATHGSVRIRFGHAADGAGILGTVFEENYAGSSLPQPSYNGSYTIPQKANINPPGLTDGFWPWPQPSTAFDYNGVTPLIVDYQVSAASDCQTMRVWFHGLATAGDYPGTRTIVSKDKDATEENLNDPVYPDGYPMIYDTRFTFRRKITNAQSKFYDTAQTTPNYGDPIINPPAQPGGASYTLEWQGAHGMPHPTFPFLTIPDPDTYTPWSTTLDVADNHRFFRFRVRFVANLNSETVPRFTQISVPFAFRPN